LRKSIQDVSVTKSIMSSVEITLIPKIRHLNIIRSGFKTIVLKNPLRLVKN
jgi:hypothetical protein